MPCKHQLSLFGMRLILLFIENYNIANKTLVYWTIILCL
jgi:hypothetical protein